MADSVASSAVQPAFAGLAPRKSRRKKASAKARVPADDQPIARVILDVQAPHLGSTFDYLVSQEQSSTAVPGVRVRVRFGPRLVDGFIWERADRTDTLPERLKFIERIVSPVVLLDDSYRRQIAEIAHFFGGTIANVLRLAIPARVAAVEKNRDWTVQAQAAQQRWDAQRQLWGGMPEFGEEARELDVPPAAAQARRRLAALTKRELSDYENASQVFAPSSSDSACSVDASQTEVAQSEASQLDGEVPQSDDGSAGPLQEIIWTSLPGPGRWAEDCVWALMRALASGMSAAVVLPTHRAMTEIRRQLRMLGFTQYAVMDSSDSPQDRYQAFLAAASGAVRCVIGLRAAMYAPVRGPIAFIAVDDNVYQNFDGFAPYAGVRDTCRVRARICGGAYVSLGYGRSVYDQFEKQQAQDSSSSEKHPLALSVLSVQGFEASRDALRPRVQWFTPESLRARGDPSAGARLPQTAVRILRAACQKGPVLLTIPLTGYAEVLACSQCHRQARCAKCSGPLHLVPAPAGGSVSAGGLASADAALNRADSASAGRPTFVPQRDLVAQCAWCGAQATNWRCSHCGNTHLRVVKVGAQGIAADVANLLRHVPILISDPTLPPGVLRSIPNRPAVVIATSGAQPDIEGGEPYQALAICDAWTSLYSQALDSAEDIFSIWASAAALVAPASEGGQVLILGDCNPDVAHALMVWDPFVVAAKDNGERRQAGLPPFAAVATVWGSYDAVMRALEQIGAVDGDLGVIRIPQAGGEAIELPSVMGPIPIAPGQTEHNRQFAGAGDRVRAIVRVERDKRQVLVDRLKSTVAQHSISRAPGELRFWADPKNLRNR